MDSRSDSEITHSSRRYLNLTKKCISDNESGVITQSNVRDISNTCSNNWSLLHQAADNLCLNDCKTLIETGKYYVDLRTFGGITPLMLACSNTSKKHNKAYELARYLLNMGANPNIEDKSGNNSLQRAVNSRNYPLIKLLIECGADRMNLSNKAEWLLYEAIKKKDTSMMKKFVKWGCNIFGFNWDGYTPLMVAVSTNFYYGVEWLLNKVGNRAAELANIRTSDGLTCIVIAVTAGYAKIVKLLIKYGANCNVPDGNQVHPIALAALNKHPKCVELLLPHVNRAILRGTNIDPVLAATSSDCYNSVALLIKSGYSLETPYYWEESIEIPTPYTCPLFDREFCTALYEATRNENFPIVKLLIDAGAKMTYKNLCYSPFLLVLENYLHIDILLEFLKNDVDINAISDDNNFDVPDALLVSLSTYKLDRLLILLSCGLDPMLKNWCGCKYGNQSLLENVMQSPDVANIKKLLKLLLRYSPSIPACCNEIANIIGKNLSKVPTLRHLCRLAVRKSFPTSQLLHGQFLKNLLIPQSLKNYLNYSHSSSSRSLSLTFKSLSM